MLSGAAAADRAESPTSPRRCSCRERSRPAPFRGARRQAPDVGSRIDGLSAQRSARHVLKRAGDGALLSTDNRVRVAPSNAAGPIASLIRSQVPWRGRRCDHDVERFQIAMEDTTFMRMGQRVGHARAVRQDGLDRQAVGQDRHGERPSLDELHGDYYTAGFADFVHLTNMGI